ncbi:MAG: hypothetical protein EXR79_13395 [Myxococcales bacterium]|nr:hypothetical protein [Myxococcales bacterium]
MTVPVHGVLSAAGGGVAADGSYAITFALYDKPGGTVVWSEAVAKVDVKNGQFLHGLGSLKPLSAALLAGLPEAMLTVEVGANPALPAVPLQSVAYALVAAQAGALACSGCVTAKHLDPAVLAPYAKVGELAKVAVTGAFADLSGGPDLAPYATLEKLADVALSGKFADLIATPAGLQPGNACGSGLVVQGFGADGSLKCVAGFNVKNLPPDALDEVSNQLLTNQFIDVTASQQPLLIADNNPDGGAPSVLDMPDLGTAQGLTVAVELTNSDIAKLQLVLTDPAGAKYVLYDKGKTGKALKETWPTPTPTVSGDLGAWVGKNPVGKWSLTAIDTGFLNNAKDGAVTSWSIQVQTLSSKKVLSAGVFVASGGLQLPTGESHPVACDAKTAGVIYLNTKLKAIYVCNGAAFQPVFLTAIGTQDNPALNCKQVQTFAPGANSAAYWIDPDGTGPHVPLQVHCDMGFDGGGWELVSKTNGSGQNHYGTTTKNGGNLLNADLSSSGYLGDTARIAAGTCYRVTSAGITKYAYVSNKLSFDEWWGNPNSGVKWRDTFSLNPLDYTGNAGDDCGSPSVCKALGYEGRNWARDSQNGSGLFGGSYGQSGTIYVKPCP